MEKYNHYKIDKVFVTVASSMTVFLKIVVDEATVTYACVEGKKNAN